MLGRIMIFVVTCCLFAGYVASGYAGETKVGGHIKLKLYDNIDGRHNDVSSYDYAGFSFSEMLLYFTQEINDQISLDLQPQFSASTGATPKFGSDIGKQKTAAKNVKADFGGWVKAVLKAALPMGYEASFGIVKPRFTMEYGAELYWEDEFNGSKFAANTYLAAMHDTGIEIYKPFELGAVSLPAYLYALNGGYQYSDNNKSPAVMVHVEPEIGRLKFTGSYFVGKWDDNDALQAARWSYGLMYSYKAFSCRGEYASGKWDGALSNGTADVQPSGYYGKLFYRYAPWGRVMLHYNIVDNNYKGLLAVTGPGGERYVTWTPGLQFTVANGSIVQVQYDIADWQQSDTGGHVTDRLQFNRLTVGWRATF